MDLVSIIIPTYNREKFISKAIDSCLHQTHTAIEILIVDDGSSDETVQVAKGYQDSRIKYFRHENNLGVAEARNTGLRNAFGEFIAFLDSDDEWMPEKLSRQLGILKTDLAGIGLVFTNGYSEYENNFIINDKVLSGIIYDPKADIIFPLRKLISPPSSWLLSRAVVNEIGYFDAAINIWDDGDYLVRLSLKYPVYFLNENLVTWHSLPDHLNKIGQDLVEGKEAFLNKNYDLMKKDRAYFFRFCRALGKDAISIDKQVARKYLFKAFLMNPFDFSIINKLIRC